MQKFDFNFILHGPDCKLRGITLVQTQHSQKMLYSS
jgi:hypothetical protein